MDSMEESQEELAQELNQTNYKDTDELYKHIIAQLDDLNNEIKSLKKE